MVLTSSTILLPEPVLGYNLMLYPQWCSCPTKNTGYCVLERYNKLSWHKRLCIESKKYRCRFSQTCDFFNRIFIFVLPSIPNPVKLWEAGLVISKAITSIKRAWQYNWFGILRIPKGLQVSLNPAKLKSRSKTTLHGFHSLIYHVMTCQDLREQLWSQYGSLIITVWINQGCPYPAGKNY